MLRREDIQSAFQAQQRTVLRALLAMGGIIAGGVLLAWCVSLWRGTTATTDCHRAEGLIVAVAVIVSLGYLVFVGIRSQMTLPRCPHCRAQEPRQTFWWLSTGSCPKCHNVVCELDHSDAPPAAGSWWRLAEYRAWHPREQRRLMWLLPLFLALYVSTFFIPLIVRLAMGREWWMPAGDLELWAMMGAWAVLCVVAFGFLIWAFRTRPHCPHCQAALTDQGSLLIATRRCGHCGGRVFDPADDPWPLAAVASSPPIPLAEVERDWKELNRRLTIRVGSGFGVGFGVPVVVILCLAPFVPEDQRRFLGGFGMVGLMASMIWMLIQLRRIEPEVTWRCPHCHKSLGGVDLLRATGCCGHCGGRVHVV